MGTPDAFLYARFVRALPDEYGHVKATLQAIKKRDRVESIRMVGTRYSTLPQKKGSQGLSRPPEQAFISSTSGGRSGARRGRGHGFGGTQGHGRGGSSSKGGGSSSKDGGSSSKSGGSNSKGGGRSYGGGSSSASSASGISHGGGSRPRGRCWQCNRRGHFREEYITKESDVLAKCARCSDFGHEESTCSSDAAVLTMELPMSEDIAVGAQVFEVDETGKCRVMVKEEVGGGELGKQVVQYIADSAATYNMTSEAEGLTNYRECSQLLGLANGRTPTLAGYGDIAVTFRPDDGWVHVNVHDVAHTPLLSYNLISLPSLALKGYTYPGDKYGVTLQLKGRKTVHLPLIGKLCRQYGYRPEAKGRVVDTACTVIALGQQAKAPTTPPDINTFHCTYGHTHEVLLKKTAGQQEVNLSGELHECRGC